MRQKDKYIFVMQDEMASLTQNTQFRPKKAIVASSRTTVTDLCATSAPLFGLYSPPRNICRAPASSYRGAQRSARKLFRHPLSGHARKHLSMAVQRVRVHVRRLRAPSGRIRHLWPLLHNWSEGTRSDSHWPAIFKRSALFIENEQGFRLWHFNAKSRQFSQAQLQRPGSSMIGVILSLSNATGGAS